MEGLDVHLPEILTQSSSGRRSSVSSSPEFEFWMLRNPSLPQPDLLSADELFSDGVLLPLDLVPQESHRLFDESTGKPQDLSPTDLPESTTTAGPGLGSGQGSDASPAVVSRSSASSAVGTSKRWKDIFKKGEKKGGSEDTVKEKKKKGGGGLGGASPAELNINLWPFSRSRSAGNGGARPRVVVGSGLAHRKVSSAPCSRSNSAGESKSRKWPASPTRVGVHLGRGSPVWQVRRGGVASSRSTEVPSKSGERNLKKEGESDKPLKKDARRKSSAAALGGASSGAAKARVLSLNVPMCMGYRNNLTCRSDVGRSTTSASVGAASDDGDCGGAGVPGEAVRGNNLFNIRNLFTKKVY